MAAPRSDRGINRVSRNQAARQLRRGDAFKHMGNVWTSQAIITVAALLHEHDKLRGGQLSKMAAGSLWRYAGGKQALSRLAPARQAVRRAIGARRIADQRSDLRDLRCIRRVCRYVQGKAPLPPPMLRS